VYCVAPVDIVAAYNGIADSYLTTGIAGCGDTTPSKTTAFIESNSPPSSLHVGGD